MSRCYRIEVSESLRRHVRVQDGVQASLELLGILPPEQMRALLGQALRQRGYTGEGSRLQRAVDGGVRVQVDLEAGTVHLGVEDQADLELTQHQQALVEADEAPEARLRLQAEARAALAQQAEQAREALRADSTARLEAALAGLRTELDQAVNQATAEALKVKARQLGEVQEILEDPATGALTIRVRV